MDDLKTAASLKTHPSIGDDSQKLHPQSSLDHLLEAHRKVSLAQQVFAALTISGRSLEHLETFLAPEPYGTLSSLWK